MVEETERFLSGKDLRWQVTRDGIVAEA